MDLRRTKIICTMGPTSDTEEMILKLAKEGMDVVRMNFSHGDQDYFAEKIDMIRRICDENNINLAVL